MCRRERVRQMTALEPDRLDAGVLAFVNMGVGWSHVLRHWVID